MSPTREPLMTVDDPLFENGGGNGTSATPKSVRAFVMLPPSVVNRFKAIAVAERRTTSVVMQRCIEDFLSKSECEPRPYIPTPLYDERNTKMYYTLPTPIAEELKCRARDEGRDVATTILRAMLDYCANSPDDPLKAMASEGSDSEEAV